MILNLIPSPDWLLTQGSNAQYPLLFGFYLEWKEMDLRFLPWRIRTKKVQTEV